MSALSITEAKEYLRIQHDAEDGLIESLLASASALVDGYLQRPVYNTTRTVIVRANGDWGRGARSLFLPFYPLASVTSVTDEDDVEVLLTDLYIDLAAGMLEYKAGARFASQRYTIVCEGGLESYPEFDIAIEPAIKSAVLDTVADLYQRRNPAAMAEREGGGVGVEYGSNTRGSVAGNFREDQLPSRVAYTIAPWRIVGVVA